MWQIIQGLIGIGFCAYKIAATITEGVETITGSSDNKAVSCSKVICQRCGKHIYINNAVSINGHWYGQTCGRYITPIPADPRPTDPREWVYSPDGHFLGYVRL
jgi:hypothetical protein